MTVSLRHYQQTLVDAVTMDFQRHKRVLMVSATGSGKTHTFSFIGKCAAERGKRVYLTAHRIEIVEQISAALDIWGVPHSVLAPGRKHDRGAQVSVAMAQSLGSRADDLPRPDLTIVDEAHHSVAPGYARLFRAWGESLFLGATATPQRTDGRGLGEAFDSMVVGPSTKYLIENGYLSPIKHYAPRRVVDLSKVRTRAGDYAVDDLSDAMDRASVTGDAIAHYAKYLGGKSCVVFCVTVAHARHVAEAFRAAGWRAASVDASSPDRKELIQSIGDGRLDVLTSCDIISEGTDLPAVAGASFLRPTESLIFYLQSGGRVLRTSPGKSEAVILDHVGSVFKHGFIDIAREWSLDSVARKSSPLSPHKIAQCPACFAVFSPARRCPACGENIGGPSKPLPGIHLPRSREGSLESVADVPTILFKGKPYPGTSIGDLKRLVRTSEDAHLLARVIGVPPSWAYALIKQENLRSGRPALVETAA